MTDFQVVLNHHFNSQPRRGRNRYSNLPNIDVGFMKINSIDSKKKKIHLPDLNNDEVDLIEKKTPSWREKKNFLKPLGKSNHDKSFSSHTYPNSITKNTHNRKKKKKRRNFENFGNQSPVDEESKVTLPPALFRYGQLKKKRGYIGRKNSNGGNSGGFFVQRKEIKPKLVKSNIRGGRSQIRKLDGPSMNDKGHHKYGSKKKNDVDFGKCLRFPSTKNDSNNKPKSPQLTVKNLKVSITGKIDVFDILSGNDEKYISLNRTFPSFPQPAYRRKLKGGRRKRKLEKKKDYSSAPLTFQELKKVEKRKKKRKKSVKHDKEKMNVKDKKYANIVAIDTYYDPNKNIIQMLVEESYENQYEDITPPSSLSGMQSSDDLISDVDVDDDDL